MRKNYKKLLNLLNPKERSQLFVVLSLTLIGMFLETVSIGVVIPVLSLMTNTMSDRHHSLLTYFSNFTQIELIGYAMVLLVVLYSVKTLFFLLLLWKQNKFSFGVHANLSYRLFAGYLCQPWTFYLQRNSAQLITNITKEVSLFSNVTLQAGMALLSEGLILFGIVTIMFVFKPIDTFVVSSILGVTAWVFQKIVRKRLAVWGVMRQYHEGLSFQHLQQGLGGVKDVKLLGRELEFLSQYNKHNVGITQIGRKQKILTDLPKLWLELITVIVLALVVLMMLARGTVLDNLMPTLGFFAAAAFRIIPSVNRILGSFNSVRFSLPIIDVLNSEIELINSIQLSKNYSAFSFVEKIQINCVSYKYPLAEKYALKNITCNIPYGSSIGFIGASGAGKSTLVDLILGLLVPEQGNIMVDDIDIHDNLRGWQDHIGYVPQTIFLTDDTLRRNVAFGLSDDAIDDVAVMRAMQDAQLDTFIHDLPQGLNTMLGERGVRLSGGQRQRIGIARALYHDPQILVLDEATSSLDIKTEQDVMSAVNALRGEKTIIIVAHRLSTVANCDWLYKFDGGRIIKDGRFEDVTKDNLVFST